VAGLAVVPPAAAVTAVIAVLVVFTPKETPEQRLSRLHPDESDSGGEHADNVRVNLKESFVTIFAIAVWFYAVAYACTGAVRHSSDQLSVLFFVQYLHLDLASQPSPLPGQ